MIKKLLAIIVLVMVASLSIAGCTSQTLSGVTASQTKADVDQYHTELEQNWAADGGHITRWSEIVEAPDTTRIQTAVTNSTLNMSLDLTAKLFASSSDATNFINQNNVGYQQTTGRNGSVVWYKTDSVNLYEIDNHVVTQNGGGPFVVTERR